MTEIQLSCDALALDLCQMRPPANPDAALVIPWGAPGLAISLWGSCDLKALGNSRVITALEALSPDNDDGDDPDCDLVLDVPAWDEGVRTAVF
ncbi:MAG: hypothetical protein ACFCBW_15490 [Candidatus Competibacterales bacterium]